MADRECWTQSYSSQKVTLLDLRPDQVRLEDIPNALAQKVRFQGATRLPIYTVAQHCIEGARLLPSAFKLPFLLHEVSEVYLPDIPGPMKAHVLVDAGTTAMRWKDLEARHADAVLSALGLDSIRPLLDCAEVKRMDRAMLAAEVEQLLSEPPQEWNLPEKAAPVKIFPMSPEQAAVEWMQLFRALTA